MGSKLKYHNPEKRNITITHLEDEMTVAWNGPSIPHSDGLIHWLFYRESSARRLKFFKVSEAVDSLLNIKSKFFL